MKKKPRYKDAPKNIEEAIMTGEDVTAEFNARFPLPSQLVSREETVKVTLALGKDSVAFFKKQAKAQKVPYQRMIKNLVDRYVHNFQGT